MKSWKGKTIVGAAAGRYHSVFITRNEVYTCGLNAGQLGRVPVYIPLFSQVHVQYVLYRVLINTLLKELYA